MTRHACDSTKQRLIDSDTTLHNRFFQSHQQSAEEYSWKARHYSTLNISDTVQVGV